MRSLDLVEPDEVDVVVRVVSELAADAVQHSGLCFYEHFRIGVSRDEEGLLVQVWDSSRNGGPVARLLCTGGYGWQMIRALAADWGYEPGGYSWVRINPSSG